MDLSIFEFPLSLMLASGFAVGVYLCAGGRSIRFLRSAEGLVCCIVLIAAVSILSAVEGTWGLKLHNNLPFILIAGLMLFALGLTGVDDSRRLLSGKGFVNEAALCHIGGFLMLAGIYFGAPDVTDAQMEVIREEGRRTAFTAEGKVVPLPFEIKLVDFKTDYYEDGVSPKQYTGSIRIDGKDFETSVNHPCHYKGYDIYQMDYDWAGDRFSVIKLVRDPWLPLVFFGMAILALGALLQIKRAWHSKAVIPVVLALAVVFTLISIARIRLGTLMPALRSLWFVPHLIVYMLAYSVLAVALVILLISICRKHRSELPFKLLTTASSLLLIGMLCGAVWAKAAWGQYWTWDPKECWAATTWLLTLIGMHLPRRQNAAALLVAILLSFAAMQVTWYGVNYLPSSTNSMHTYNNR